MVASDTDVLMLLVYTYDKLSSSFQVESLKNWYMKIDTERHVNIGSIVRFYGSDIYAMSFWLFIV